MAEYIEREAAIAAAFSANSLGNSAFRDVYDTVNRLRLIPAADVQAVRHGRWIAVDFHSVKCALCGFAVDIMKVDAHVLNHMNYCPNCGAKMDGGA